MICKRLPYLGATELHPMWVNFNPDICVHCTFFLKSTRRWRHCITSHRHSPQSPNNIDVSQHFVKKKSERKNAYNQHIGRLNTNDAKDSAFHWQTIIIEYLEVCYERTVGLFVWSRDHLQSPCCSKYLNRKWVSAVKIAGIAVKTATIKELAHERQDTPCFTRLTSDHLRYSAWDYLISVTTCNVHVAHVLS